VVNVNSINAEIADRNKMSNKSLAIGLIIGLLIGIVIGNYLPQVIPNSATEKKHYPLYDKIYTIKNRIIVNITDPNFLSTGKRECIWFELREEDSGDYFQTTVNFWVFQDG
jgi:ATP sulfurylase